MSPLIDWSEVIADRANFRVADLRVEDFGENLKLPLTGQLLIVQIIRVRDDGTTASSFNLVLYPALNRVSHLKCTVQWKICGVEYLCFCCPPLERTTLAGMSLRPVISLRGVTAAFY